jgi:hypothetical protein
MDGASTSAFFTNPGTSLALAFAALLIVISYTLITINFIVTLVESYLVVSVGFIFLGFGGSRWTAPYTERYIGLAVSIGIKIVLLYCLISAGFDLSLGWLNEAQGDRNVSAACHDRFRCDGRRVDLHDVLLADSETVCSSDRRLSRIDRRRSGRDGCRCRRCRPCSGWRGGCRSWRASRRGRRCGGGHRFCGERRWRGFQHTTAVASVGSVGAGSSAGGGSVSPPSSPSPGSRREWRRNAQAAGPAIKWFGRRWRGRSARGHHADGWK